MPNVVDIIIKGTNQSKKALSTPIKDLKDLGTAMKQIGPAMKVGVSVAVTALAALVKAQINVADETAKTAQKIGVSIENLSTLRHAADLSGTSIDAIQTSLGRLSATIIDASRGLQSGKENFESLGISIKRSDGSLKSTNEILFEVADKFQKMPDGVLKTGLAIKIFGKSGADLIPLLNQGAAGIAQMQGEARKMGLEFTSGTAKGAEQFNDQMTRLNGSFTGAINKIMSDLLPGLNELSERFVKTGEGPVGLFKTSLDALGASIRFVSKLALSLVSGVSTAFSVVGDAIGGLAAGAVAVYSGEFRRAGTIYKETINDFVENSRKGEAELKAIWTAEPDKLMPPVPDPSKHQQQTDVILTDAEKRAAKLKEIREKETEERRKALEAERALEQRKQQGMQTTDNLLAASASFATTVAQDNATARKGVAIGQATISSFLAVTRALAEFPLNPAYAFGIGALGLAQVANIAATPAFQGGGVLQGNSRTGDRQLFRGNAGETILNEAQTLALAQNRGGGATQVAVYLDSKPVLDIVSKASRDGRLVIDASGVR